MGITRFRAYQLGEEGSSFSYCHDGFFTLIEARLTEKSYDNIFSEIHDFGNKTLNTLHITSWDNDHCDNTSLRCIIKYFKPNKIEYPGYLPHTDTGKECKKIINSFVKNNGSAISHTPEFIDSLEFAEDKRRTDIIYWPREIGENSNNNSTIKFFRMGHFTVLSLGDVESKEISTRISNCGILTKEVDVMILAHHGADNGFTCDEFLDTISPNVAICSSNYDNQFEHPKEEIRNLLYERDISIFSTKTGDIIIQNDETSIEKYKVFNLISGGEKVSSVKMFYAKTY